MGPQEMLDRAEVKNKWMLTPMKNFKSPELTPRLWRTPLAVMVTALIFQYLLPKRNPCFALIGAVYGVGSQFEEGFQNGINRFIGTFIGGLLVIPFHWLYIEEVLKIPGWIWLVAGLCLVLWCSLALGVDSAIQPGIVVYFVVMYTVGTERVVSYTIARVLDTGIGVLISLILTMVFPTKYDKEKGLTFHTCIKTIIQAMESYKNKNKKSREKDLINFGWERRKKIDDEAGEKWK